MNPQIQGHSGTTPEKSRNAFSTNQGTNEDDSQSDPHPEAGIFGNQTMRNSGQEERRDINLTLLSTSFIFGLRKENWIWASKSLNLLANVLE